jgi:hypothetical protein
MSKKGNPYVRASLRDSVRQQDGTYKDFGWYQVTIFNNVDEIVNAGRIKITAINSIEHAINDYNGKRYENYSLVIEGTAAANSRGCKPDYESAMYDYKQPTQGERSLDLDPVPGEVPDLPF